MAAPLDTAEAGGRPQHFVTTPERNFPSCQVPQPPLLPHMCRPACCCSRRLVTLARCLEVTRCGARGRGRWSLVTGCQVVTLQVLVQELDHAEAQVL